MLFVVSADHVLAHARRARRAMGPREGRSGRRWSPASTRSTGSTSRSRSSTSPGSGTSLQGNLGPSYKFHGPDRQRHRRRRHLDHRPARADGVLPVGRGRHPARDLRRPRPQPVAGLCLDRDLGHRHRHAQLRPGHPADPLIRGDAEDVADGRLEGSRHLDPADHRAGQLPDRDHHPLHAGVDARGDPQGLHPDRPEQGRRPTGRSSPGT